MGWFFGLSARTKILAVFGLVLALLVAVASFAYTSLRSIRDSQQALYDTQFANAVDAIQITAHQNHIRSNLFQMIILTDRAEQDNEYRDIKELEAKVKTIADPLFARNRGNEEFSAALDQWMQASEDSTETRDNRILPPLFAGDRDLAYSAAMGEQVERYQAMREASDRIVALAQRNAADALEASDALAAQAMSLFLAAAALGIGVTAVAMFFLSRAMRAFTREINEGVSVLAASSSEIMSSSTQVAAGATETASAIAETTSTVEEVRQTAHLANQKAKAVSDSSQRASDVARTGSLAVQETADGMRSIREQMDTIAESITRLSEQGQSIGGIIGTVDDIAEQSNLLAVNAAIEAAKAGEQGRGFGVVAQEMRNLAEQSKEATKQVRQILNDIQRGVSQAGMATEQGARAVHSGTKRSEDAGKAIRTLQDGVTESAQAALQIAASSQQQLAGMDQVATAMESIREAGEQNAAATRQVEDSARGLGELGQKLKQLINHYKI